MSLGSTDELERGERLVRYGLEVLSVEGEKSKLASVLNSKATCSLALLCWVGVLLLFCFLLLRAWVSCVSVLLLFAPGFCCAFRICSCCRICSMVCRCCSFCRERSRVRRSESSAIFRFSICAPFDCASCKESVIAFISAMAVVAAFAAARSTASLCSCFFFFSFVFVS